MQCVRSCDCGKVQQGVLKQQSHVLENGECCVFGNLSHRLPDWASDFISQLAPDCKTAASEATARNEQIRQYLWENREALLGEHSTSFCAVHKKLCPVYPGRFIMPDPAAEAESQLPKARKQKQRVPTAWWERQSTLQEPPVTISAAGLCCTDFSVLGKQRRTAGVTERWHHIWEVDRARAAELSAEHFYFTECAATYPAQRQCHALDHLFTVVRVKASPHELGFPVRRPRMFSAGLALEWYVWVGPAEDEEIQQQWDEWFHKQCFLTGDSYFSASKEDVHAWTQERASARKSHLPPGWEAKPMEELLPALLPAGAVARKSLYDDARRSDEALDGAYLCHLEHNPGFGPSAGPSFPPLDTHPNTFSYKKRRLAIPCEYFQAQGLDMLPNLCGARGLSPLAPILSKIAEHDARFMAGNSLHVPTYLCWMLFCVRADSIAKLSQQAAVADIPGVPVFCK